MKEKKRIILDRLNEYLELEKFHNNNLDFKLNIYMLNHLLYQMEDEILDSLIQTLSPSENTFAQRLFAFLNLLEYRKRQAIRGGKAYYPEIILLNDIKAYLPILEMLQDDLKGGLIEL